MSKTIKVAIVSLGCSKNQVDAEQMMAKIARIRIRCGAGHG